MNAVPGGPEDLVAGLDDDALLALLGRALSAGPAADPDWPDDADLDRDDVGEPPADAVALAKAAWSDAELDAELLELLFDSEQDRVAEAMRAAPAASVEPRSLTFEGPGVRIEIELGTDGVLMGQLVPGGPAEVELHTRHGVQTAQADRLGRFRFDMPVGRLRLRVGLPGGAHLLTPWVTR